MKAQTKTGIMVLVGAMLLWVSATCMAGDLIISEIAWAGTAASSSDEWMEIQNPGEDAVALEGWTLSFGGTTIQLGAAGDDTVEARTATLGPGDYLLLERTDDTTVSDIEADVLYKGALSNAGVDIELRDPDGVLVDSVSPLESGWPAGTASGDEPPYATMERLPSGSWATNNGLIRNGLDADGNPLNGTPGQTNSAQILAERAPAVTLLQPIEEGFPLTGTVSIKWTATDPDGPDSDLSIEILVSSDGGSTWSPLVSHLVNGGSYSWNTEQLEANATYRLKVTAQDPDGYVGEALSPDLAVAAPSS